MDYKIGQEVTAKIVGNIEKIERMKDGSIRYVVARESDYNYAVAKEDQLDVAEWPCSTCGRHFPENEYRTYFVAEGVKGDDPICQDCLDHAEGMAEMRQD